MESTNQLRLTLGLPVRNPNELQTFLRKLYDPASPRFHHYLTPQQFTEKFGPAEESYQSVLEFARQSGFTVTATHPGRMLLEVSAKAGDVEKAFRVRLLTYQHPAENRLYFAPDTEPSAPSEIPILDVRGLDSFTPARPLRSKVVPLDESGHRMPEYYTGDGPDSTYIPEDFQAAYASGVTVSGAGQSVGLLEFDNYYPSDIRSYETTESLPNVRLQDVKIGGFNSSPGINNGEVAADIEMAIGLAPGLSTVIIYEAPPAGSRAAYGALFNSLLIRMAEDDAAAQLSSSWNPPSGPSLTEEQIFQQMAAQGQSFFQASGDDGAYTNGVFQIADNPYATIVGATGLWIETWGVSGPGGEYYFPGYGAEWVWNTDSNNASGGGSSANYPIPCWQEGVATPVNGGSPHWRNSPDVAMFGDGAFVISDNGRKFAVSGTSLSAPLWAAFTALANEQAAADGLPNVGFLNPAIYAIGEGTSYGACFHDVTIGGNSTLLVTNGYDAVAGYDLCTGWGTPTGQSLLDALTFKKAEFIIVPTNGFTATSIEGGSFDVSGESFSLSAAGWTAVNWSVGNLPVWLDVTTNEGSVGPNQPAQTIDVSLDTNAADLTPGIYQATIIFTNLTDGSEQSIAFTLRVLELGALQISLGPDGAVQAGAEWRVDGGPWQNSGAIVTGLVSTNHTVDFLSVPNWTTPPSQTVTIQGDQTNALQGIYQEQLGSLTVALSPSDAVTGGAHWRVDGGNWMNIGDTVSGVTATNHSVEFSSIPGWLAPAAQTVLCPGNQTTQVTGLYTELYQFTTIAGSPGSQGSNDGANGAARFSSPNGIAVDANGNVFVVDTGNSTIRELSRQGTNWVVTTISGTASQKGTNDGAGGIAQFNSPLGIAVDSIDNVYVTDTGNDTIRMLQRQGTNWVSSTIAGSPGVAGNQDGTGATAQFSAPAGIAVDTDGSIYETDVGDYVSYGFIDGIGFLRHIVPSDSGAAVSTFKHVTIDGLGNESYNSVGIWWPSSVTMVPGVGPYLISYPTDSIQPAIYGLTSGWVDAWVGGYEGYYDSYNVVPVVSFPFYGISNIGLASDARGNIYAAASGVDAICKWVPPTSSSANYSIATVGGVLGYSGYSDGSNSSALFNAPASLAVDANGVIYISDTGNHVIRTGSSLLFSIQILASPTNSAVQAGLFQVDGGAWTSLGSMVRMAAGEHTITFESIPGWIAPSNQIITVVSNQSFGWQYVEDVGSLTVTLDPVQAATAGAQWQLDDGAWMASGTTISNVQTGLHSLAFTNVGGWITPTNTGVIIAPGSNTFAVFYSLFTFRSPSVSISSPAAGQRWTNQLFTMAGSAADGVALASVWYQINGGGWIQAAGTNQWQSTPTALAPGSVTVQAYAIDTSGNFSKTNTVRFVNAPEAPVTVTVSGSGTVSPNLNGQFLTIGRRYTMTAKPASSSLFSNWTGDFSAQTSALSFIVQTNTAVQANFVPSPFLPIAGVYEGLFYNTNEVNQPSSGFFSGRLAGDGTFSASLQLEGASHSISGRFSLDGSASNYISRAFNPISLSLSLDLSKGTGIAGKLVAPNWESYLTAYRCPFSKGRPAPQAGHYTLRFQSSHHSSVVPGGDGFGAVTVDALGNIKLTGTLGDGSAASQSAVVSQNGLWPFYISLYSGQGSVLGWLAFTNTATSDLQGSLTWMKTAKPGARFYASGFSAAEIAEGSAYDYSKGVPLLGFSSGQIKLAGGNLSAAFTNQISLEANNAVKNLSSNPLAVSISTASGIFLGSVTDPVTRKKLPVSGVVLQKQNAGYGLFLGSNQTGRVFLGPVP